MIIRSIIYDQEDPYSFHVQIDKCHVCDEKKLKKRIRRSWQSVYPFLRCNFTVFYEECDFDEV